MYHLNYGLQRVFEQKLRPQGKDVDVASKELEAALEDQWGGWTLSMLSKIQYPKHDGHRWTAFRTRWSMFHWIALTQRQKSAYWKHWICLFHSHECDRQHLIWALNLRCLVVAVKYALLVVAPACTMMSCGLSEAAFSCKSHVIHHGG